MIRIFTAISMLGLYGFSGAANAWADTNSFGLAMDGAFRGSGTTISGSKEKKRRVSCNLTNTYDEESGELKIKGKCAGSQGSRRVKGALIMSGNSVSGTFLAPNGRSQMTKSSGSVNGKSMTVFSSFINEDTGKSQKFRQVVRISGSGFKTSFFAFDKKANKYKPAGSISFKRK